MRYDASNGRGSYLQSPDGLDVRAFRPAQPQITFTLPDVAGLSAHGAVITGAQYNMMDGFRPVIIHPEWDMTGSKAKLRFRDRTPAALGLINGATGPAGSGQTLVLSLGQFQSGAPMPGGDGTEGTELIYTHVSLDVYYSDAADTRPPSIGAASAVCSGPGSAALSVMTGHTNVQQLLALVGSSGAIKSVPMMGGGGTWMTTLPLPGSGTMISVEEIDAPGNVSTLSLPLGSDVVAGCPMTGAPTAPQPQPPSTNPPTGRTHGTVKIASVQTPPSVQAAGPYNLTAQGSWTTGGDRCDAPGAAWMLAYYIAPAGTPLDALTSPSVAPVAAPCGSAGMPSGWQTTLVGSTFVGPLEFCAGLFFGDANGPITSADSSECRTIAPPDVVPRQTCNPRVMRCP
jgi:hypothetical protein